MVNTPMRPPNRDRNRRRPPKGPRLVPISRADQKRVSLLQEASAYLSEQAGMPEHAATVDFLMTVEGRKFIDRMLYTERSVTNPSMAITIPQTLRDQIKTAVAVEAAEENKRAALAGEEPAPVSITWKANQGLERYLAGDFPLPQRTRSVPLGEGGRVSLNIRPDGGLQERATAKVREETGEGRASSARVILEYLMFSYGLGPYAKGVRPVLEKGAQRNLQVPRRVRDRIREMAAASGDAVDDIINEGYQRFLDGAFDPQPVVWLEADQADMAWLKVHPNNDLFTRVQAACKGRPGLGANYGPSRVAVDYLLDEFSIDPEAAAE